MIDSNVKRRARLINISNFLADISFSSITIITAIITSLMRLESQTITCQDTKYSFIYSSYRDLHLFIYFDVET